MSVKHAIKTATAAVLTILLYQSFNIPEGYWAAISAVIVMQANLGGSLSASWNRLLGSAIGATVGAAWIVILGRNPWSVGAALTLTILLCSYLKFQESYRIASVTVILVMLVTGPSPWMFGLYRFLNVVLGIIVALLVSIFIWPSRARDHLQQGLAQILMDCGRLQQLLVESYLKGEYQEGSINHLRIHIKKTVLQNWDLLKESLKEPGKTPAEDQILAALMIDEEKFIEQILAMDDTTRNTQNDAFQLKLKPQLTELTQTIGTAFTALAEVMTARRSQPQLPELKPPLVAVDEQLFELRKVGVPQSYPLDEIMRFYSVVFTMKELVKNLQNMIAATTKLA